MKWSAAIMPMINCWVEVKIRLLELGTSALAETSLNSITPTPYHNSFYFFIPFYFLPFRSHFRLLLFPLSFISLFVFYDHSKITGVTCDDTKIVSSGDKCVRLWDWVSDTCARTITLPSPIFCLKSDSSKLFAAGQDRVIRLLSPETSTSTPKTFLARLAAW